MSASKPSSATPPLSKTRRVVIALILLALAATLFSSGSSIVSNFFDSSLSRGVSDIVPELIASVLPEGGDQLNGFGNVPLPQRVAEAGAIVITVFKAEGGSVRNEVTEILKRPAGGFPYKVGDAFVLAGRAVRDDASALQGEVLFFSATGDELRFAAAYRDGRIGGMGDVTLDRLRELVKK